MPELPEVTTTANKLNNLLPSLEIIFVWTNYNSPYFYNKQNIKDPKYFLKFKKNIIRHKIKSVYRIGKNVLINIDGSKTILIHMKMTGHLLYGKYKYEKNNWTAIEPGPLQDKFNQHIRLIFKFSNGKSLALSDVRKFAKVCLIEDDDVKNFKDISTLGPDPTTDGFNFKKLKEILLSRPHGRIKNILINQNLISGIGNIYSDEALWLSGIHPETSPIKLTDTQIKKLLKNIKNILKKGLNFGGDSTSDYRQPDGNRGQFQKHHKVYRLRGKKCLKKGCKGIIIRKIVGGRSAHFCDTHQKLQ